MSDLYIDDERLPEVAQFRRLIRDIDRHLSPIDDLVDSFEAFGLVITTSPFDVGTASMLSGL